MADSGIDHARALAEARDRDSNMLNVQSSHAGNLNVPHNAGGNIGSEDSGKMGHTDRLRDARSGGIAQTAKVAKDLAEVSNPVGAISLLKQINPLGDIPFFAALGSAMLKDLLDFATFETIILPALFSALCTIFIFMMMLLAGASGKKKGAQKLLGKVAFLLGGGVADAIPGLDFFPIETMTVIAIYIMELIERKNAGKE